MTRDNYLELAYLKKNPVLSAEEEAGLPEQFQLRDPEDVEPDVLDLIPIGLAGNKVDVIITGEEDAIRCQHEVYWPGCAACEFSGPKGPFYLLCYMYLMKTLRGLNWPWPGK